jgi:WD40 repeat protein
MTPRFLLATGLKLCAVGSLLSLVTMVGNVRADEVPTTPFFSIESGMHNAAVHKIAIDAENRYLASASLDKTIRIWSLPDGKLLRVLRPPIGEDLEGRPLAVAISPDGKIVACGGVTGGTWDGFFSIYLFERETGRLFRRLSGLSGRVTHLAFSRDGLYLAATARKNGFRLYRSADWSLAAEDRDYDDAPTWAEFNTNGRVATISPDGFIRLYDIRRQTDAHEIRPLLKKTVPGEENPSSLSFSPDGTKVAIAYNRPNRVDIVSATNLELLATPYLIDASQDFVELQGVTWSHDGKSLYAAGMRGKEGFKVLLRWDLTHGLPMTFTEGKKKGTKKAGKQASALSTLQVPCHHRVFQMLPLSSGGIAFACGDPTWGIIDDDNRVKFIVNPTIPSYKFINDTFLLSENGDAFQFGYEIYGDSKSIFSFRNRQLSVGMDADRESMLPSPTQGGGLTVTNWKNALAPQVNGITLDIGGKHSRSLAVLPDNNSFLLGTDDKVYRFDRTGKPLWQIKMPANAFGLNISRDNRLFVVALGDGTIRWFTLEGHREILAFFPHPDRKRWIAWCPEGYFDASPGAEELIGFHLNQGKDHEGVFIPMNNLYDVYYRPDIIQAKLRGDDISGLVTITPEQALKSPPPTVRFTSVPRKATDAMIKVCYRVSSNGGGIGEVRLFQNGKLIKSDGFYREAALKGSGDKIQLAALNSRAIQQDMRSVSVHAMGKFSPIASTSKGDSVDECTDIEPAPGENEVSVAAFNASNTVQSFMETASFTSDRKPGEPHLYILAVGIDTYRDASINLKYAAKDAHDLAGRLSRQAASIFKPENIHVISLANAHAGKAEIISAIDALSGKIKQGDSFVFFDASHGVLIQNQYYIVTADFNGDLSTTKSLVGSNEIVEMSKRIKSLSQLFVFDTCHAGGIDAIVSGLYDARMSVMAKKMGLHIYASAGSLQSALDGYQGNGLFTHSLLAGIDNGKDVDKERDGMVTVKKLGHYAKEKTTELSTRLKHPQTPLIINFGRDNPLFEVR